MPRPRDVEYVTITIDKVVATTPKAVLVRVEDVGQTMVEVWIPRSVMDDPDGLAMGDEDEDVSVASWFARREALVGEDDE